jgi:hypothetical protein
MQKRFKATHTAKKIGSSSLERKRLIVFFIFSWIIVWQSHEESHVNLSMKNKKIAQKKSLKREVCYQNFHLEWLAILRFSVDSKLTISIRTFKQVTSWFSGSREPPTQPPLKHFQHDNACQGLRTSPVFLQENETWVPLSDKKIGPVRKSLSHCHGTSDKRWSEFWTISIESIIWPIHQLSGT